MMLQNIGGPVLYCVGLMCNSSLCSTPKVLQKVLSKVL